MNAETLLAEGMRLGRPSLVLRKQDADEAVVGVWGGAGIVPAPPGTWQHWLTVECRWLVQHGFAVAGCLSLYENLDEGPRFVALVDEQQVLPHTGHDGELLVGREEVSMPPLEALEVFGSEASRHWVKHDRWSSQESRKEAEKYDREWQRSFPLYASGVYAVLGGWHMTWPDMDAYDEEPGRLLLWTLQDSEPWVEIWLEKSGALKVVSRIT